jgi:type I restriction enzyme S subunit
MGWTWCRLHEIYSENNVGIVIRPTQYYTSSDKGIPAFRNTNIKPNKIDETSWVYLSHHGIQDNPRCIVHENDLLVSRSGNAGICCVATKKYEGYGAVDILLISLFPFCSSFFISNCINSPIVQQAISRNNRGVALSHIGTNTFANILLPLPPFSEQKRIVVQIDSLLKCLEEINQESETLEKSLTLAKQKILDLAIRGKLVPQDPNDEPASELLKKIKAEKETLIKSGKLKRDKHESFIFRGDDNCYHENVDGKSVDITDMIPFNLPDSWEWVRLASLGSVIGGGTPSTSVPDYWDGAIPWLSPCDLSDYKGKYISRGKRNISQKGLDHSSAVLMPSGSILYSSRAPIGYVVIASNQISTNQGFKSLVPIVDGMDEFIYYTLKALTPDIRKRATGTTFKEISGSEFGKTMLPLPPLAEQKRIVSQIEKLFSILETMHG